MNRASCRCAAALAAVLAVAGCTQTVSEYDPVEEVARARYVHDGPPALTLYTMINNRSNSGAHTSLMINGSQRVIFDPAGSVSFSAVPERADILYGVTPEVAQAYASAHARETYRVAIQRIEVSPDVAEAALQLAVSNGAVRQAFCTNATSSLLSQLPGFESIRVTFFPNNLRAQFAQLPGVTERVLRETDEDDKAIAIQRLEATFLDQGE